MPSATGSVTAILDGHTLISPTVYFSFDVLSTIDEYGKQNGNLLFNQIVPMSSTDVSSVYENAMMGSGTALFDWSNLNAPLPLMAYAEGAQDWDHTIYEGDYIPYLSVPRQVSLLDPSWSTCATNVLGANDPPYALHGATEAADPAAALITTEKSLHATSNIPIPGPTITMGPSISMTNPSLPFLSAAGTGDLKSDSPSYFHSGGGDSSPSLKDTSSIAGKARNPGRAGNGASTQGDSSSNFGLVEPTSEPPELSDSSKGSDDGTSAGDAGSSAGPDPNSGTDHEPSLRSIGDVIASVFGISKTNHGNGPNTEKDPGANGGQGLYNTRLESQYAPKSSISTGNPGEPQVVSSEATPLSVFVGKWSISSADGSITALQLPGHPGLVTMEGQALCTDGPTLNLVNGAVIKEDTNDLTVVDGPHTQTISLSMVNGPAPASLRQGIEIFTTPNNDLITLLKFPGKLEQIVVGGKALSIGGPAQTVDGIIVSAVSGGLIMSSSQTAGSSTSRAKTLSRSDKVISGTVDGKIVTALKEPEKGSSVVIDSKTLSTKGPAATIDGQIVSQGSNDFVLMNDSTTSITGGVGGGEITSTRSEDKGSTTTTGPLTADIFSSSIRVCISSWMVALSLSAMLIVLF